MPLLTFRCPNTGYIVHGDVEHINSNATTIDTNCTACKSTHRIDLESGEVVPPDTVRGRVSDPKG
jgi:hypothetical protein